MTVTYSDGVFEELFNLSAYLAEKAKKQPTGFWMLVTRRFVFWLRIAY